MKVHNGVLSLTQFPGQEYYLKADADQHIKELQAQLDEAKQDCNNQIEYHNGFVRNLRDIGLWPPGEAITGDKK